MQIEEMPPDLSRVVLRWILSVADTKHQIGMQFSHWVTGTPALEAAVGSAAITQDELGHARSPYRLIKNHPDSPSGVGSENDLRDRQIFYAPKGVVLRWKNWTNVVAIMLLLDSAIEIVISKTANSAFVDLAGKTSKIIQEEYFHRVFAASWVKKLATMSAETQMQLQNDIAWAWSIADSWIGPSDDPAAKLLVDQGILNAGVDSIREEWLAHVQPILEDNGLYVPDFRSEWHNWNVEYRE
ncbi:MAG: Phenylacetic acid catabolic protein [Chloroflexota bacterium]